jgi:ABC-type polysaccharide/polyol phosphate export permease
VGSLNGNVSIIKHVYYPREIFPLTIMLSEGVNMSLGSIVLIPVILIWGIIVTQQILLLFVFSSGAARPASS